MIFCHVTGTDLTTQHSKYTFLMSYSGLRGDFVVGFSPPFCYLIRRNPHMSLRYCLPQGLWLVPSGLLKKPLRSLLCGPAVCGKQTVFLRGPLEPFRKCFFFSERTTGGGGKDLAAEIMSLGRATPDTVLSPPEELARTSEKGPISQRMVSMRPARGGSMAYGME